MQRILIGVLATMTLSLSACVVRTRPVRQGYYVQQQPTYVQQQQPVYVQQQQTYSQPTYSQQGYYYAEDENVVATMAPPPEQVEVVTVAPSQGHVWVPGYQRWYGGRYQWQRGYWTAPPRQGASWNRGGWNQSPRGGWQYRRGYWR